MKPPATRKLAEERIERVKRAFAFNIGSLLDLPKASRLKRMLNIFVPLECIEILAHRFKSKN
jgi:hypothetical protein